MHGQGISSKFCCDHVTKFNKLHARIISEFLVESERRLFPICLKLSYLSVPAIKYQKSTFNYEKGSSPYRFLFSLPPSYSGNPMSFYKDGTIEGMDPHIFESPVTWQSTWSVCLTKESQSIYFLLHTWCTECLNLQSTIQRPPQSAATREWIHQTDGNHCPGSGYLPYHSVLFWKFILWVIRTKQKLVKMEIKLVG
jgi:hypothetical protein